MTDSPFNVVYPGGTYDVGTGVYTDPSGQGFSVAPQYVPPGATPVINYAVPAGSAGIPSAPAQPVSEATIPAPAPVTSPPATLPQQVAAVKQEREAVLGGTMYATADAATKAGFHTTTILSPYGYEYIGGLATGRSEEVVKQKIGRDTYKAIAEGETPREAAGRGFIEGLQSPVVAVEASYLVGAGFGIGAVAASGRGLVLGTKAKIAGGAIIVGLTAAESYDIVTSYPENPEMAIGRGVTLGASLVSGYAGYKSGTASATKSPYIKKAFTTEQMHGRVQVSQEIKIKKPGSQQVLKQGFQKDITSKQTIISKTPPKAESYFLREAKSVKTITVTDDAAFMASKQIKVLAPEKMTQVKTFVTTPAKIKKTPFVIEPLKVEPISASASSRAKTFTSPSKHYTYLQDRSPLDMFQGRGTIAAVKPIVSTKVQPFAPIVSSVVATPKGFTLFVSPRNMATITAQKQKHDTLQISGEKSALKFDSATDLKSDSMTDLKSDLSTDLRIDAVTDLRIEQITKTSTKLDVMTESLTKIRQGYETRTSTSLGSPKPIPMPPISSKYPTLFGGNRGRKAGLFGVKSITRQYEYKPSLVGMFYKMKFKLPKQLTGIEIRPRRRKR